MFKELWTGQITIEWQSRGGLHEHIPLVGMNMEMCCIRSWICNSKTVEVSYTRESIPIVDTAGGFNVLGVLCGCRSNRRAFCGFGIVLLERPVEIGVLKLLQELALAYNGFYPWNTFVKTTPNATRTLET
jgi:hypothetical protein